jgi:hypothetical protein
VELSLQIGALYKSATDSTLLRCRLSVAESGGWSAGSERLFSRDLDIVWGDRHYIQIRNTTHKAVEMFAAREALLRGLS